jgi:hypothetical protein
MGDGGGEYTTTSVWFRLGVDLAAGRPYSGSMQQVILLTGFAGLIGGLALVVSRWSWDGGSVPRRIVLGVIPGICGALLIGFWQLDLVPDQMESALLPFALAFISFALGLLVFAQLRAR